MMTPVAPTSTGTTEGSPCGPLNMTMFAKEGCIPSFAVAGVILIFLLLVLPICICICICVRRGRRRRRMEVGTAKPASSDYKIQSTHTDMADNSFAATETSNTGQLRPANSMQGFTSVSLRVPSYDPLPPEDPPGMLPRATADIKQGTEQKNSPGLDKMGRRDRGYKEEVTMNPDLREVKNDPYQNVGLETLEMVSTAGPQSKHHDYTNTSLPYHNKPNTLNTSLAPKVGTAAGTGGEAKLKVRNKRVDEDGYDLVEKEDSPDDSHIKVRNKPTNHMYHVLEDKSTDELSGAAEACGRAKTHKKESEGSSTDKKLEVVMEDEKARKSLLRRSIGQTLLQPSHVEETAPEYHDPWVSRSQAVPSRRTTYSDASNRKSADTMFDDPMYDCAYAENTGSELVVVPSSATPTTEPAVMHPRTRSVMQTPREPVRRYGEYEMTANFGTGDVSEFEVTQVREETTFTFPTQSPASKPSDHHVSDTPGMFDDPAYDVGLNLKK